MPSEEAGERFGCFPRAMFSVGPSHCQAWELTAAGLFDSSRIMDTTEAVTRLSALAQESRLNVFRMLVRAGREGLPAGDIARALAVPHNTMSSHLAILTRAKLVQARKEGRSVIYALDLEGTRGLLSFLMEDCCQGEPAVCGPVIESTLAACCAEACCSD
jgi:ArsR family transcriptional regulator, arsenate/arsenite/antimonite-responsive transcriptional repressor